MKKYLLLSFLLLTSYFSNAQRLLSWTPEFPLDNSTVVIVGDATKGNKGLFNYEGGSSANVYVHVGVITNLSTSPTDWKYTKFTWGTADPLAHAIPLGSNKYQYTIINPRSFFGVPAGETILKITCIFRTATGSAKQVNSDGSDMYIPVYSAGQYAVRLNLPPTEPRFIPWLEPITGTSVPVQGVASIASNLDLSYNGVSFATASGATTVSGTAVINSTCGQSIVINGTSGASTATDSANYYIAPATVTAALPTGAVEGINYDPNNTAVTLVLYAPNKNHVVVIGDFSNWQGICANQMKRSADGNYYWLTLTGLTPGTEYGYQYVVDDTIKIADPYSQKILDPNNDQYIDAVTYPNLKPYPTGHTTDFVSVFQPAEPAYNWQVTNFTKPDKKNLMIYELLIRDFTAQHSYQSLIDSIQYLKNTGINAIELMPINEFDGNESWGYNPDYYFAPDKYYGPKNKLKEFVDLCHQNGIAVILDVVYNHCTGNAPEAKLYWNSATSQPAANNPWLNVTAPHPYSVYNDFNHTSTATQYLVQRSLNHWIDEYKIDGYRFDLAKGFTQTPTNTTTVENFDASRVANIERYYDGTISGHPGTYMILEFLGTLPCAEEQEYAAHGLMLWDNANGPASQCTMGYTANSDLSLLAYNSSQKNYNNPAAVGYMESHDEERTMYRNLSFGNSSGGYNVTTLATALAREEAAAAVFFTVPGPKMIWQFEERGYDISIGFGGSNVANKPPHWEYMLDANRRHLYNAYHSIMQFRLSNPAIFNNTTFSYDLYNGSGLYKLFQIAGPASTDGKVTTIANLDVTAKSRSVTFQTIGTWTSYISNGTGAGVNGTTGTTFNITAANQTQTITLQPGEYHIYYFASSCTTAAPTGTTPVNYCQNATASPLTATGTSLLWYTAATGGTGSSTAPTPSTTTAGSTTYYVSQTLNSCEGPRFAIVVNIAATPAAPVVSTPVVYCQNTTAAQLTATGTNLLWYTSATGGTGSSTAPTPSTGTAGSTIYYVSQTTGTCESPRAAITVTVNAAPAAPGVTSPVTLCQNSTASPLTATGTNLLWYTSATGGTGSATAPTPSTTAIGVTAYYVSQTIGSCESPRAGISVNVITVPIAPAVVTPVIYCQNATATALTATGANLQWYTVATGGTGSSTAPTPSTTIPGNTIYYVSQSNGTCESPRSAITVTVNPATAAPTVTTPVTYCQGATATPLTATGTSLLWYTAATGGTGSSTAPTPSTAAAGSTTYYVSQTLSCGEGPRAAIVVNVNALPAAPGVTSSVAYCQNATAVPLTATGTNLIWYTTATGGTGSATAPTPSTATAGSTTYYVSQTVSTCEGPRAAITVNVTATPAAPTVSSPVTYCQNSTAVPLTATGTNLLWYTTATGGTGSATAPTPVTTTIGSTNYYVSQSTGSCEGPRATITVNITASTPAPTVVSPVSYCQGSTAVPLTATGSNLLWYTAATGGTGSATAPTPSTAAAGSTTYYVSQTQTCGESPRAAIVVNVNALPAAPGVTSPVAYCQNTTAVPLTATGTNLLWYTTATGGTGSATAPTPSTASAGSVTYYVSQTASSCEGPRAAIVVNVTATPAAPTVSSPVTYCQNTTATALTATGTNLLWYTTATGGTGSATAPTPVTTTVGSTIYYVSQSANTCEGPRAAITVNIVASTPAPAVVSPIAYCQNATAVPLTATGTALLWYTAATGGTGSSTAPTPSTATVGSTTYYVSQTLSCGEGPRAAIVVNINAIPAAPGITSPVAYCQNTTAVPLTATGSNLLWYATATGGTGSSTAPTPTTTSGGTTTYYVSQTTSSCEGPRAAIVVNVTATPVAPTVSSPVTYCQNTSAVPLTATGTNLLWYTTATGGTGSSTAPTPATTTVGSTNYYVSQSTNTCEGPRALITVNIVAATPAPTVTSPVAYCQNATAVPLTATGTALLWYTAATGGTGSSTAPTPSTATVGSTTYYVSQTLSCGEGPRAAIVVNINAIPAAPGVTSPVAYCQNTTAVPLTAAGSNLLWYATATGGTGSSTAPTPSTTSGGSTTYYVSQTTTSCEGPRAAIVVNVTATPAAPTVSSPISYCQNTTAVPLTAIGSNLLWYTAATGGTGSSTAPTPSTVTVGSTTYYVSQSTNTCEGPRASITVNIVAATPAPTVTTPVAYCQGATSVPLTATGTALLWYTAATGGTGSSTAPTPSTATVGSTTYYVSQTLSCGEGPRAAIVVNINPIPVAPAVTSPIAYCQNTTAVPLTATGSNLLWYTAATGGTGSSTAPTPSTASGGSTTYYVSQTTTSCEGPRAAIVVNVTATPAAPTVTSPVTYCQNTTAVPLTATGTNLLWYTSATGGTGSATAPTPSTAVAGSTNYYVSQSTNTCEGPRASITVNITASTPAPTVTSPVVYCQGTTSVPLTATGTALLWYTAATGGTGSATAPTPSTTTAGNTIYYVSQTLSCGEGPRAAITVTVNPTPGAASVTPIAYCQGTTAGPLTATGTNLLWYTTATGGTGNATAPTPSTTTVGNTTYYVSQTTGTCEGPRTALTVTVNPTPAAPGVTSPVAYCRNSTAVALTATGTNLLWYTVATGGTGNATAPVPSTATAGSTIYYVSQTTGTCEGPRAAITVTVTDIPAAPAVDPAPLVYCQNTVAVALTATGNNLLWYTAATGGTGNATDPVPSTATAGSTIYYVSQSNGCGESVRAAITVNIVPSPAAPTNLTATGITATSAVLSWNGPAGAFYTVEYKTSTAAVWTTAVTGITVTTYTLTGLVMGTSYDFRVNANCAPGVGTIYTAASFTTTSRNNSIPNIADGIGIKLSPVPVSSSSTEILDYIVPGNGQVTIVVYDAVGQEVKQLVNAVQAAGQYQLDVTSMIGHLRSGTYFIKLRQGSKFAQIGFVHM